MARRVHTKPKRPLARHDLLERPPHVNARLPLLALAFAFTSNISFAQYIEVPNQTTQLKNSNGLILGFINPKNFSIQHSFNMSYGSFGNEQVSLASYTATMTYIIRDNMKLSADVTMQYSPFASISGLSASGNRDFQNSFNGINLSRVSFDYKPVKNMFISINYFNNKNNNYNYWLYNNSLFNNRYFGF